MIPIPIPIYSGTSATPDPIDPVGMVGLWLVALLIFVVSTAAVWLLVAAVDRLQDWWDGRRMGRRP